MSVSIGRVVGVVCLQAMLIAGAWAQSMMTIRSAGNKPLELQADEIAAITFEYSPTEGDAGRRGVEAERQARGPDHMLIRMLSGTVHRVPLLGAYGSTVNPSIALSPGRPPEGVVNAPTPPVAVPPPLATAAPRPAAPRPATPAEFMSGVWLQEADSRPDGRLVPADAPTPTRFTVVSGNRLTGSYVSGQHGTYTVDISDHVPGTTVVFHYVDRAAGNYTAVFTGRIVSENVIEGSFTDSRKGGGEFRFTRQR